jgi:hypothetical protein
VAAGRRGFVFISFKSEEREAARLLKEALEKAGFPIFWAPEIQTGKDWHVELDRAVTMAGCVVVLWSKASMASDWVRHEASQAMARGVYLPARLEPMEILPPFNRLQATDLMRGNKELSIDGLRNLTRQIDQLLPLPVPLWRRALRSMEKNWFALVSMAFIVVAIAVLSRSADTSERRKSQATSAASDDNAERWMQPIRQFDDVEVWMEVERGVPEMDRYLGWLEDRALQRADAGSVTFDLGSAQSLWPDRESRVYRALFESSLDIAFRALATPDRQVSGNLGRCFSGPQDLWTFVRPAEKPALRWSFKDSRLEIGVRATAVELSRPEGLFGESEKIATLRDLEVAELCVAVATEGSHLQPIFRPLNLKLQVGKREFSFRGEQFRERREHWGTGDRWFLVPFENHL